MELHEISSDDFVHPFFFSYEIHEKEEVSSYETRSLLANLQRFPQTFNNNFPALILR